MRKLIANNLFLLYTERWDYLTRFIYLIQFKYEKDALILHDIYLLIFSN